MAARIAVDPYSGSYGGGGARRGSPASYGAGGNGSRPGSGAGRGPAIEDLTQGRGGRSSPAEGSRRTSGANSYAASAGASSAGYALPTLAAASMLNLPPLKSSVVVVAPQIELPSPASTIRHGYGGTIQTPSGISVTAGDFSAAGGGAGGNRRSGSRSPSPAATPRGSGTAGTGMYSLAGSSAAAAAAAVATGAAKGPPKSGPMTAADKADAAFEEESGVMGTAKKLALPKRIEEGEEMVAYRARQAKEYQKKLRSLISVNVMTTRSLGLMSRLRDGHATGVTALSFVDDGSLLASGAQDGLILVWNLELQKFERTMDNHQSAVTWLSWHPDTKENQMVSASSDSTVKIWDVDTGTPMITLRDHGRYSVTCAVFSSDGDMLATTGMSSYIIVYNCVRMRSNWIAARKSSKDMMLCVIKPFADGNEDGHKQGITKVCWSKGNDRIVSSSEDGSIRVWNVPRGGSFVNALLGHTGPVTDCSFDPLGERLLSAGADGTIRIWNVEEAKCYRILKDEHKGPILQAVWTPEGGGRRIVSIGKTDRQIVLWEASTGLPMQRLENLHGSSPLYCVAARPDALMVATGGGDKIVGVWRAESPGICEYIGWTLYSCFGGCYKACCDCSDVPEYVDDEGKDATGVDDDDEEGGKKKKKKGEDDDDDLDPAVRAAREAEDKAGQEARRELRKTEGLAALRAHKAAKAAGGGASSVSPTHSGANAAVLDVGEHSDEEMASASPLKGAKQLKVKSKRGTRDYASAAHADIGDNDSGMTAEGISARVKARDIIGDASYAARANRGVKF